MFGANSQLYAPLIKDIPETTWAYLAGMIDGEGCIAIRRNDTKSKRNYTNGWRRVYVLTVSNTSMRLLNEIHEKIKVGRVKSCKYHNKPQNRIKHIGWITFEANTTRVVLPKIIPYLILKKELAEIMQRSLKVGEETHDMIERREKLKAIDVEFHYAFLRSKDNQPHRTNTDYWNKIRAEQGRPPTVTLLD